MDEIKEKEKRVNEFLVKNKFDGLIITKRNNFAWITAGKDNHVVSGSESGIANVLITKNKKFVITNNIELERIKQEELSDQNFEFVSYYWFEPKNSLNTLVKLAGGPNIVSDDNIPGTKTVSLIELQYPLTVNEIERYRWLGEQSSKCLTEVCKEIKPGQTEYNVAGDISSTLLSKGIYPEVILIASDDRIFKYRHPIPTNKKIKKYVMVVVCAQKYGLIVSLTRLVHFGKLTKEIKLKHESVTKIDASFILNSKPGTVIGDVFKKAELMYKETGYANEWKLHHQGGPTGYNTRDYLVTENSQEILVNNRALAWNPSITGTKSEDTIIVNEKDNLILTSAYNWPMIKVELDIGIIERPDILVK